MQVISQSGDNVRNATLGLGCGEICVPHGPAGFLLVEGWFAKYGASAHWVAQVGRWKLGFSCSARGIGGLG